MFSTKYSLNKQEIISALKTALIATVSYFTLTVTTFAEKVLAGDLNYIISVAGFFGIIFGIKLFEKFLRNVNLLNEEMAKELLDQKFTANKPE